MRIEITAGGIHGAKGEIPVGTIVDVKDEPKAWAGRYRVIGKTEGKTAVTNDGGADNGGGSAPTGPFSVKEQSAGWFAVVDADGNAVTKNFRADDLKSFDGLSDEDKAKFIAENNPKAPS